MRYELTTRPQDDSCGDYVCPLEVKAAGERTAKLMLRIMLEHRDELAEALKDDLEMGDDAWFQLFHIDNDNPPDMHDDEEYWQSYEVL